MIKHSNRSDFYLDISKAKFIEAKDMEIIKRELPRAARMMPAQAEERCAELEATVKAYQVNDAKKDKQISTLNDRFEQILNKLGE